MSFISYAQNFEDVMLWRALKDVDAGFYIDVGANDPDRDTVTRAFYERGWSGINLEPVASYHAQLCRARPRDINLRIVAGATESERQFHEIAETGLSTLDPEIAERHRAAGWKVQTVPVQERPLRTVWREHVRGDVHFLKIDVEGAEGAVLSGCDLRAQRPWVIVVEAMAPLTQVSRHEAWEPLLTGAGYDFVYFDGLNRFYVAAEHRIIGARFAAPPNFYDDFVRASEAEAVRALTELRTSAPPAPTPGDLAPRIGRIEQSITEMAASMRSMVDVYNNAVQQILCTQVAYLGDHRALTYLRNGQKLFVDTRSVDIGTHLLLGGDWEPNYMEAFLRMLRPGDVVLDIGANHGVYTLRAADVVKPAGHVYAFEPSRNFFELVRASVSVNGLDAFVTVEQLAAADARRDVTLVVDRHWSGGGHLATAQENRVDVDRSGPADSETVHCVALDEHFGDALAKVDAIKMDIEGAEGLALKGMAKLIDRSPRVRIMMEFCPAMLSRYDCDADFVIEFLKTRNFMCWTIGPDGKLVPARWEALLEPRERIQNIMISRLSLP